MIPKNLFLMWDKPRDQWPDLVALSVRLWEDLNPDWNITIFNDTMCNDFLKSDFNDKVLATMKIQFKSDILRTKLLFEEGGVWADASCLPHRSLNSWISEYHDQDFAAPAMRRPGRTVSNWFMISKKNGLLMSKQYRSLVDYWKDEKLVLPQRPDFIEHIEDNWREYVSDYTANTLKLAPYFLWHYIFALNCERDVELGDVFSKLRPINTGGKSAELTELMCGAQVFNDNIKERLLNILHISSLKVTKLNRRKDVSVPLEFIRQVVIENNRASLVPDV